MVKVCGTNWTWWLVLFFGQKPVRNNCSYFVHAVIKLPTCQGGLNISCNLGLSSFFFKYFSTLKQLNVGHACEEISSPFKLYVEVFCIPLCGCSASAPLDFLTQSVDVQILYVCRNGRHEGQVPACSSTHTAASPWKLGWHTEHPEKQMKNLSSDENTPTRQTQVGVSLLAHFFVLFIDHHSEVGKMCKIKVNI